MANKSRVLKFVATLSAAAALLVPIATAQLAGGPGGHRGVILYDQTGFSGEAVEIGGAVGSLSDARFNDKTSSIQVLGGRWEVCTNGNFGGRCEIIRGDAPDLRGRNLNNNISSIRPAGRGGSGPRTGNGGGRPSPPVGPNVADSGPITLFSQENFRGEARSFGRDVRRLSSVDFNDRARSVRIISGVWLLCEDANFGGRCEYVDRDVPDLRRIGLRGNISSISLSPYDVGPGNHAITLFQNDGFRGAFLGFDEAVRDLSQYNYNDTASSIRITSGRWLVCEDRDFRGACDIVRGNVRDLNTIYLNDRITSLRRARSGDRPRPRGGYGDTDYPRPGGGHDGDGNGPRGDYGGIDGQDTVFFPRPTDGYGERIRNGSGEATRYCRDLGFRGAAYKGNGRYLKDVLCEK